MSVRASLLEIKSQGLRRFSNDLERARRQRRILRTESIGNVGSTGRVKRISAADVPHIFVGQFRDGDDVSLNFPPTSIANSFFLNYAATPDFTPFSHNELLPI